MRLSFRLTDAKLGFSRSSRPSSRSPVNTVVVLAAAGVHAHQVPSGRADVARIDDEAPRQLALHAGEPVVRIGRFNIRIERRQADARPTDSAALVEACRERGVLRIVRSHACRRSAWGRRCVVDAWAKCGGFCHSPVQTVLLIRL